MDAKQERRELIDAMRWLRSQRPNDELKCIRHGWYGHCIWSTEGEAGVLMTVKELREQYRAHVKALEGLEVLNDICEGAY